jgi:hypothetical protein
VHSVLAVTASKGVLSAATWLAVHVADVAEIKARLAAAERNGIDGSGCFNSQLNAFAKVAQLRQQNNCVLSRLDRW